MKPNVAFVVYLIISVVYSISYAQQEDKQPSSNYKSRAAMRREEILKRARSERQRPVDEKQLARMRQAVKALSKDFTFKGKVVDFQGNPVDNAVVLVSLAIFEPAADLFMNSSKHEISTDKNGRFVFKGNCISLSIRDIIKDGYEFNFEFIDYHSFNFNEKSKSGKAGKIVPLDTNFAKPAVMKIRKRGTVDFLFYNSFSWPFRITKNESFQPLLLGKWNNSYGKEFNFSPSQNKDNKPLDLSCEFNDDNSKFKLHFKVRGEDSGVYLSDTLLYQAPLDGYQKEVFYSNDMLGDVENGTKRQIYGKKLFLYIKGPGSSYYSRVDLIISTFPFSQSRKDGSVRVSGKIYTNPEGRRYLEYDKKFNSNEKVLRNKIRSERSQARMRASKNKEQFDEKEFKKKIKAKYKNRDWEK